MHLRKMLERALDDDDWTRMKLPTSLGGMGIGAVTSRQEREDMRPHKGNVRKRRSMGTEMR